MMMLDSGPAAPGPRAGASCRWATTPARHRARRGCQVEQPLVDLDPEQVDRDQHLLAVGREGVVVQREGGHGAPHPVRIRQVVKPGGEQNTSILSPGDNQCIIYPMNSQQTAEIFLQETTHARTEPVCSCSSATGLYVTDLPRMAAFYKRALRFTETDAGDLGPVQLVFLSRDPSEHHQLVLATGRPRDRLQRRQPDLLSRPRHRHAAPVLRPPAGRRRAGHAPVRNGTRRSTAAIPRATGWSCSSTRPGTASSRCASRSICHARTRPSLRRPKPSPSGCRNS